MSATSPRGLVPLFEPRSIAVVGASATPEKVGYQLVEALREFAGYVFPINPKAREVAGRTAYPHLNAAPRVPDLVLLAVPAAACPTALLEAAAIGVPAALIVSGGFTEMGTAGEHLQAQIQKICGDTGLRVLGPNTSGYTRPELGCHACFVPAVRSVTAGSLAIVAQSGGVNLTLTFMANQAGVGVRCAVGLGNSVDVDAADVIEYFAEDAGTQAIAVHLEGVRHGRRLYDVVAKTTASKPVVALPVGRGKLGEFARSHTGNLMGTHAVTAAALRQAGAIVVDSTQALIDSASTLAMARLAPKADPGVSLVTGQAGPGLIILDALLCAGVLVPPLSESTVAEISRRLPGMTYLRNPIDTGRPSPVFGDIMIAAANEPSTDVLLAFALDEPAAMDATETMRRAQARSAKPVVFATQGLERSVGATASSLRRRGIPVFDVPERAVTAVRALVDDAKARHRRSVSSAGADPPAFSPTGVRPRDEAAAKALLKRYGIHSPRSHSCASRAAAVAAFADLCKPVVVKVLDAAILHKTDVGGVHLDVRTVEQLHSALDRIDDIPGDRTRRSYLLEEMAADGVDLILGARQDASFGLTVLIGLGGTAAEVLGDASIRLAPVAARDVEEMVSELRGAALLDGWRGAAPASRVALVNAVLAIADLMATEHGLQELDINPLRCGPNGVLALDALMIWEDFA